MSAMQRHRCTKLCALRLAPDTRTARSIGGAERIRQRAPPQAPTTTVEDDKFDQRRGRHVNGPAGCATTHGTWFSRSHHSYKIHRTWPRPKHRLNLRECKVTKNYCSKGPPFGLPGYRTTGGVRDPIGGNIVGRTQYVQENAIKLGVIFDY